MKEEAHPLAGDEPLEIERKFLILYPEEEALRRLPGARVCDITQTYLTAEKGERRVRAWQEDGRVTYYETYKEKLSDLRRIEREKEIDEGTYQSLLREAKGSSLHKRRYTIPYGRHKAEIDIYPFWSDRAILEIELSSEDEPFSLPPFVTVLQEVTGERAYKNPVLAETQGKNPPPLPSGG